MSKLLKLKKYLTIEDTARYLFKLFGEPFSIADVYELVLDEQLLISARFINKAYAKAGRFVTTNGSDPHKCPIDVNLATGKVLSEAYFINLDDELKITHDQWLVFDKHVLVIDGIRDLAMIGMELQKVKELYQEAIDGPSPQIDVIPGFYVRNGDCIYQLQGALTLHADGNNIQAMKQKLESILKRKGLTLEGVFSSNDSYVLDCLDEDELDEFSELAFVLAHPELVGEQDDSSYLSLEDPCYQLVIRTDELVRFVQLLQDEPESLSQQEKPLAAKERNTHFTVIRALCLELKIDPAARGTASVLQKATELSGTPLSHETIRQLLIKMNKQ